MKKPIVTALFLALSTICAYSQLFEQEKFEGPAIDYFTKHFWMDINADGLNDLFEVSFTGTGTIHLANEGSFNASEISFDNLYFEEGRFGFNDYDGDGDIDILTLQNNSIVIIEYDETSDLRLVNTGITVTTIDYGDIFWVDINGDLMLDVILGRKIFLYRDNTFIESQFKIPNSLYDIVFDDMNNDGLLDLIAGGYDSYDGSEINVFLNNGEGFFNETPIALPKTKLKSTSITMIDVDADSDTDIFVHDTYFRGWIFTNDFAQSGNVSFIANQIFADIILLGARAGDVNSDGLQDLIIADRSSITILKNTSTSNNLSFLEESYELQLDDLMSLYIVDLNNDDHLDIHLKGKGLDNHNWTENWVYKNTTINEIIRPSVPQNLSSSVNKNVTLSWDNIAGLHYNLELRRNGDIYKPSATSPSGRLLLTIGSLLYNTGSVALHGLSEGDYEWRIQALNAAGHSSTFSATNTFSIGPAPTSLFLEASELEKVTLCWSFHGFESSSFIIFRRTSSGPSIELARVNAGITCYTDETIPKNQIVEYHIVAEIEGVYSAPSNTVTHHATLFVASSFGTYDPNIISAKCFPADFDQDGDYDLGFIGRIGNWDNNFLLKNTGTGVFIAEGPMLTANSIQVPYTEVSEPRDIDNDGDIDIVVITGDQYSWQRVTVYLNNNGTFITGFETPEYLGILQLAVEDFNNDGRPDLLFSHTIGNSPGNPRKYQLLYQTIEGSFEDSHIILSDAETNTSAYFKCADLNKDGFIDILWASPDYTRTQILVNNGGMGFTLKPSILPVTYSMGITDYSGDGNVDIMVLGNEGLNLYFGNGDFTFTEPKVIPVEYLSGNLTFTHVDIDLNGLEDLLVSDGYNIRMLLNKGNSSFKSAEFEFVSNSGSSVAITDFENDGDIDIVALGNDYQHQGLNTFYRNQLADINIQNAPPSPPASVSANYEFGQAIFSWAMATDDLTPSKLLSYNLYVTDSNGKIWYSPETNETGSFRRRLAKGNVGYSTTKILNNLPPGSYIARIQAIDAAFALSSWSEEVQLSIIEGPENLAIERILLNKIKLSWNNNPLIEGMVVIQRRVIGEEWVSIAELPEGTTSFVDENLEYNKLYQYKILQSTNNYTTGTSNIEEWSTNMWVIEDTEIANLYGSMDVADYTGDGQMDMIINGAMIYNGYNEDITRATFENSSTGWIKQEIEPSSLSHTARILFADLNGDFTPDIYQSGFTFQSGYKTETFLNNGDRTFSPSANLFTDGTYEIQAFFDFDMDNDLDVVVTKLGSYPTIKSVYKNNGNGNYSLTETLTCNSCREVAVADFDRDGDDDVIRLTGNNYELYLNTPDGTIATGTVFSSYETRLTIADYNDDGFPDVILLTSSHYQSGKIYKNLGPQSDGKIEFAELPVNLSRGDASLLSADFDHDGHTDLVVLSPHITILLNQGDDTFQLYKEPGFRVGLHIGKIIDFDNDGDLDIYLSGYHRKDYSISGRKSKILLNQTIVAGHGIKNTPPDPPQNLVSRQDSLGIHLSWDVPNDDHTSSAGLTYDVVLYKEGIPVTKGDHNPITGQRLRLTKGKSAGTILLNNLPEGQYLWRVQAIDGSFAASHFSEEKSFMFLPAPPAINDTTIYSCGNPITLTANGSDIKWYRDSDLTEIISSGEFHPEESQVVYVTQTINGVEGIPKRVKIEIYPNPPLPGFSGPNPYKVCEGSNYHVLWVTGENIKWYSNESLTTILSNGNSIQLTSTNLKYYVTQTINGCESYPLTIDVQPTTIDPKLYYSEGAIRAKETGGDSYIWFRDGLYYTTTSVPFIPFDGEIASYVALIWKEGCQKYTEHFVSAITNIPELSESILKVYPNPASSYLTIKPGKPNLTIHLHDTFGKTIYSKNLSYEGELKLDISEWPKGVYFLVVSGQGETYAKKLVFL